MSLDQEYLSPIDLDQEPDVVIQAEHEGKDYTLRPAPEESVAKFRANQLQGARLVDGKLHANAERAADAQSLLVSMCLYDDQDKLVLQGKIRRWPSGKVRTLFDRAMKISRINEPETVEDIDKQIAELQRRRAEIVNGREDKELGN